MAERNLTRREVLHAILSGEVLEDYPHDFPLPSALFFAFFKERPIHVVAAFDSAASVAYIITVYEPDLIHFEKDFKTRRKP